jgi:hypothetical protein
VRGEGWKCVEILPTAQYPDLTKFGRIHPVYTPVTEEIRLEIETLQAEQEQIEDAHQDVEEYPQTLMRECPKSKLESKS